MKRTFSAVVGIFAAVAGTITLVAVFRIASDLHRADVSKLGTMIGLMVASVLVGVAYVEAYRFLKFAVSGYPIRGTLAERLNRD